MNRGRLGFGSTSVQHPCHELLHHQSLPVSLLADYKYLDSNRSHENWSLWVPCPTPNTVVTRKLVLWCTRLLAAWDHAYSGVWLS